MVVTSSTTPVQLAAGTAADRNAIYAVIVNRTKTKTNKKSSKGTVEKADRSAFFLNYMKSNL